MKNSYHYILRPVKTASILIASVFILFSCSKESDETEGSIKGVVTNNDMGSETIYPAFIFLNDSLLATTDENGEYSISSLKTGEHTLTCSALNFSNSAQKVKVVEGISTHNFSLQSDTTIGRLVGEFQDLIVLNDSIISNPDIDNWDDKEIHDAATGATIQKKWFPDLKGQNIIYLGNDSIGKSDAFGQYGLIIQCGTYSFTGTCEGYKSKTHVVTVTQDSKTYLNFLLEKE